MCLQFAIEFQWTLYTCHYQLFIPFLLSVLVFIQATVS